MHYQVLTERLLSLSHAVDVQSEVGPPQKNNSHIGQYATTLVGSEITTPFSNPKQTAPRPDIHARHFSSATSS